MAACQTCGREILWARNAETDKMIPLRPNPVANGSWLKLPNSDPSGAPLVRKLAEEEKARFVGHVRYQDHFAMCRNRRKDPR